MPLNRAQASIDLTFVARWAALTALGWGLGLGVSLLIRRLGVVTDRTLEWIAFAGLAAFFQWVALRRRLPRSGWWVLASLPGLFLVRGLLSVSGYLDDWLTILTCLSVGWGLIGVPQALVLWAKRVPFSVVWVPVSGAAWGFGWAASQVLTDLATIGVAALGVPGLYLFDGFQELSSGTPAWSILVLANFLSEVAGVGVASLIMGIVLARMLGPARQSSSAAPPGASDLGSSASALAGLGTR